jgi:hypothetical protein
MNGQWKVAGSYFEACNCEAACPCVFTSPPTDGTCTVLLAWHIESGNFAGATLDDLNVVFAAYTPGHMLQGNWKVALYLDERADTGQKDALQKIFSGQAGGHLAALGPLIGQVMGVKSVPIEYRAEGRTRGMRIPDIAEAEIEGLAGQGGADISVNNVPFTAVPAQPLTVSRSRAARYDDHGISLDVSGKNGFYSPFSYESA